MVVGSVVVVVVGGSVVVVDVVVVPTIQVPFPRTYPEIHTKGKHWQLVNKKIIKLTVHA